MASQSAATKPRPDAIMDLMAGFRRSQVLFAAHDLGVFDACAADSLRSPAEIIEFCRWKIAVSSISERGMERLLNGCVALGLLRSEASDGVPRYALNDLSRTYLASDSPDSLDGYVGHSSAILYKLWGNLATSVAKNDEVWEESLGFGGDQLFAKVYNTEDAQLRFMRAMHSPAVGSPAAVASVVDLSAFKHMVDLGGGTGALCSAALARFPSLRATLVDLPPVTKATQKHFVPLYAAEVCDRLAFASADIFDDAQAWPAGGDLVALSRILHDWDDARCERLLRRVFEYLPRGGALLLCEKLLDEDGQGPVPAVLQDLNMLVQTKGCERSASRYGELLSGAGFVRVTAHRTGAGLDAVLAHKA